MSAPQNTCVHPEVFQDPPRFRRRAMPCVGRPAGRSEAPAPRPPTRAASHRAACLRPELGVLPVLLSQWRWPEAEVSGAGIFVGETGRTICGSEKLAQLKQKQEEL